MPRAPLISTKSLSSFGPNSSSLSGATSSAKASLKKRTAGMSGIGLNEADHHTNPIRSRRLESLECVCPCGDSDCNKTSSSLKKCLSRKCSTMLVSSCKWFFCGSCKPKQMN